MKWFVFFSLFFFVAAVVFGIFLGLTGHQGFSIPVLLCLIIGWGLFDEAKNVARRNAVVDLTEWLRPKVKPGQVILIKSYPFNPSNLDENPSRILIWIINKAKMTEVRISDFGQGDDFLEAKPGQAFIAEDKGSNGQIELHRIPERDIAYKPKKLAASAV